MQSYNVILTVEAFLTASMVFLIDDIHVIPTLLSPSASTGNLQITCIGYSFFEHPKQMLKLIDKKLITTLR